MTEAAADNRTTENASQSGTVTQAGSTVAFVNTYTPAPMPTPTPTPGGGPSTGDGNRHAWLILSLGLALLLSAVWYSSRKATEKRV